MTLTELHRKISTCLENVGIEQGALEARFILEHLLSLSYGDFLLRGGDTVTDKTVSSAEKMAERRVAGEPLQYIIGEWDFMGHTFRVGEGVLIPRPETEILCEYVLDKIRNIPSPVVYDLCSGSGCIGISIKKARPDARVILVEKSEKALKYLRENCINICGENKPEAVSGDILHYESFDFLPNAHVIISNPPYIKSEEIASLQREVQREPRMALDGGEDGLLFYRYLVSFWSSKLRKDGFMAFECGEDQSEDIRKLFSEIGFDSRTVNDYNNIQRFVIGRRNSNVI